MYTTEIGEYKLYRRNLKVKYGRDKYGYGRKIATDICLKFSHEKRERRVYCTQISNVGSCWIIYKGTKVFLPTHFQDEIE